MLKLKVVATGSSGNCYLLKSEHGTLVLDCGVPIRTIKSALDWRVCDISAVLVSHIHADHSKSVADFEKMGITVWKPYLDDKKIQRKHFGDFTVTCFDVPHNGVENRGFLIESDGQKILYATDFEYIPYNFRKNQINHFIIECNYDSDHVDKDAVNFQHKVMGHASLSTALGILEANVTDACQTVLFVHMSDFGVESDKCIGLVRKVAKNADIYIASYGLELELFGKSEVPF